MNIGTEQIRIIKISRSLLSKDEKFLSGGITALNTLRY